MIGIFDSGIGGLTVLRALQHALPQHPMLYLADFGYSPYGSRSEQEILCRSQTILQWMKKKGATLAVVACHTSSAVLTPEILENIGIPIVTMLEPTIHSILHQADTESWDKGVGFLATALSIQKGTLVRVLREKGFSLPIHPIACPDLVPLIESRQWGAAVAYLKQHAFSFFQDHPVNAMVYGCTHYPLIEPWIKTLPECSAPRIDPAHTVAVTVASLLQPHDREATRTDPETLHRALLGHIDFYHTGAPEQGKTRLSHHWPGITSQALCLNPASPQMA